MGGECTARVLDPCLLLFLKRSHEGSKAKYSFQSGSSVLDELSRGPSLQYGLLDLEPGSSEEQQVGLQETQSAGELEEWTDQAPHGGVGPQTAEEPIQGEKRREKRVSYSLYEEVKEFPCRVAVSKQSQVSTSTEDGLFQKVPAPEVQPLTVTWTFGWNSSLPVFYIREECHRVLLYVCAHTVVIYNTFRNKQHHLQGHPNVISCLCVSEDRRWIATADKGPGCLIIIWDSFTGKCASGSGR